MVDQWLWPPPLVTNGTDERTAHWTYDTSVLLYEWHPDRCTVFWVQWFTARVWLSRMGLAPGRTLHLWPQVSLPSAYLQLTCPPGGVQATRWLYLMMWVLGANGVFMVDMKMFNWMWNLFTFTRNFNITFINERKGSNPRFLKHNFNCVIFKIMVGNSFISFFITCMNPCMNKS